MDKEDQEHFIATPAPASPTSPGRSQEGNASEENQQEQTPRKKVKSEPGEEDGARNAVRIGGGGSTGKVETKLMRDIKEPHAHDVLCGRGGGTNNHPGNEHFRDLVNDRKVKYLNSSKREKPLVSRSIVDAIRRLDPPGRFLQKDEKTGLWYDIGDQKAREKTSQALREGAPVIRREISMGMTGGGGAAATAQSGLARGESAASSHVNSHQVSAVTQSPRPHEHQQQLHHSHGMPVYAPHPHHPGMEPFHMERHHMRNAAMTEAPDMRDSTHPGLGGRRSTGSSTGSGNSTGGVPSRLVTYDRVSTSPKPPQPIESRATKAELGDGTSAVSPTRVKRQHSSHTLPRRLPQQSMNQESSEEARARGFASQIQQDHVRIENQLPTSSSYAAQQQTPQFASRRQSQFLASIPEPPPPQPVLGLAAAQQPFAAFPNSRPASTAAQFGGLVNDIVVGDGSSAQFFAPTAAGFLPAVQLHHQQRLNGGLLGSSTSPSLGVTPNGGAAVVSDPAVARWLAGSGGNAVTPGAGLAATAPSDSLNRRPPHLLGLSSGALMDQGISNAQAAVLGSGITPGMAGLATSPSTIPQATNPQQLVLDLVAKRGELEQKHAAALAATSTGASINKDTTPGQKSDTRQEKEEGVRDSHLLSHPPLTEDVKHRLIQSEWTARSVADGTATADLLAAEREAAMFHNAGLLGIDPDEMSEGMAGGNTLAAIVDYYYKLLNDDVFVGSKRAKTALFQKRRSQVGEGGSRTKKRARSSPTDVPKEQKKNTDQPGAANEDEEAQGSEMKGMDCDSGDSPKPSLKKDPAEQDDTNKMTVESRKESIQDGVVDEGGKKRKQKSSSTAIPSKKKSSHEVKIFDVYRKATPTCRRIEATLHCIGAM